MTRISCIVKFKKEIESSWSSMYEYFIDDEIGLKINRIFDEQSNQASCICIAISFVNWTTRRGKKGGGDRSSGSPASVNPAIPKRFTLRAFRRVCGSARVCIFRNISVPSIPRILDVPSGWDVIAWASPTPARTPAHPTGINVDVCTGWIWPEVGKERAQETCNIDGKQEKRDHKRPTRNCLSLRLSMGSWMDFITPLLRYGGKVKWENRAIFGIRNTGEGVTSYWEVLFVGEDIKY